MILKNERNIHGSAYEKPLFNPRAIPVLMQDVMIGEYHNLNDFNNMRYAWVKDWYRQAMNNFWIPEEIDLSQDIKDYPNLTENERTAYNKILSFLVFLDSIQTYSSKEDASSDDQLIIFADIHDCHTIGQNSDDQYATYSCRDFSFSACQTDTTDDCCCQTVHLHILSCCRCPELIRASMMIPASPDKNPPIAYVATFNLFVLIPDILLLLRYFRLRRSVFRYMYGSVPVLR